VASYLAVAGAFDALAAHLSLGMGSDQLQTLVGDPGLRLPRARSLRRDSAGPCLHRVAVDAG
jgi:hypothetical protein